MPHPPRKLHFAFPGVNLPPMEALYHWVQHNSFFLILDTIFRLRLIFAGFQEKFQQAIHFGPLESRCSVDDYAEAPERLIWDGCAEAMGTPISSANAPRFCTGSARRNDFSSISFSRRQVVKS